MAADPVIASVHIDAPPERVYEYFTRPQALISWMGDYALLEAEPGGRFHLDIRGTPVRGRFLTLDPPRRLVISWGYAGSDRLPPGASTVEVRFTADGGGTRVDLEHRDLPPAEGPRHVPGWTHYLTRLQIAAPGRDPGPDPGMPDACPADTPVARPAAGSTPYVPKKSSFCPNEPWFTGPAGPGRFRRPPSPVAPDRGPRAWPAAARRESWPWPW